MIIANYVLTFYIIHFDYNFDNSAWRNCNDLTLLFQTTCLLTPLYAISTFCHLCVIKFRFLIFDYLNKKKQSPYVNRKVWNMQVNLKLVKS